MPTRESYDAGTPCWVDLNSPDMDSSVEFYQTLFDWDADTQTGPDGQPIYVNFQVNGSNVAGLGAQSEEMAGNPAVWTSYIAVDDTDETVERATAAGGQVVVPPRDVMDEGRMAMVSDPTGAVIAMWQAGNHIGAQTVNEANSWAWNELLSRDVDTAKSFYSDTFGWTYQTMDMPAGPYHVVEGGEEGIAGIMAMPEEMPGEVPNHWGVYFLVDDADTTISTATDAGAHLTWGPQDLPIGRLASLVDPHGAAFSIMQPPSSTDD